MKLKITESQYNTLKEELIIEISADKVMGAAKKMWQDKIGNNRYDENPRAKKLLTDYANRLKGLKLFGGEVRFIDVDLIANNDGKSFFLMFNIATNSQVKFGSSAYTGLFYNFSTDQFMVGAQISSNLTPINDFSETSITKHDARQLYKIASHLNPETRYVNYTREIPINVDEGINPITGYDLDKSSPGLPKEKPYSTPHNPTTYSSSEIEKSRDNIKNNRDYN